MNIEFDCPSCGKHYKVADTAAGKRAKCKECGGVIQVPGVQTQSPQVTPPKLEAAPPRSAPPIKPALQPRNVEKAPPNAQARCPSCQTPLEPNAVFCTTCGFDLRKGVKIAGVADADDDQTQDTDANETDAAAAPDGAGKKQQKWWSRFLPGSD